MACAISCIATAPTAAINVKIDYTYDTNNFFGSGNPQGQLAGFQARAALKAAAAYYTNVLDDAFSPIVVPPTFHSSVSTGTVSWQWTRSFNNPSTGGQVSLVHSTPGQTIAADEYVVFAGARNLSNSAGIAGPGQFSWRSMASGAFSFAEITQISSITSAFQNQVERRGEPTGFANWGGTLAFDTIPPSPWHYDHTASPPTGAIDFYTVALHELAHTLGLGASTEWDQWRSGLTFNGPNAVASNGGLPVPLADVGHWASSVATSVYGRTASQPPLLSAIAPSSMRYFFTELDAAGMKDIGWTVVPPPAIPEPASGILVALGSLVLGCAWRRRYPASNRHVC